MLKIGRFMFIRIVTVVAAVVLTLVGMVIQYAVRTTRLTREVEASYGRAVAELTSYMNDITSAITKGIYVSTEEQITRLSSKLLMQASGATSCLAELPVEGGVLEKVNKFLSQASAYAISLSEKVSRNEKISKEETETLYTLLDYSKTITEELNKMSEDIRQGKITLYKIRKSSYKTIGQQVISLQESTGKIDELVEGAPKLIYDGPYSEHLTNVKPSFTEGKPPVTREQAKLLAAKAMLTNANQVINNSDEAGNMPLYCFGYGTQSAGITKSGGYLCYILNSRPVNDLLMTKEDAMKKAVAYMGLIGVTSMEFAGFDISENICTLNFAYSAGGIIHYTDLIKVSVAMDNGEIVGYDARSFILNHKQRTLPSPKIGSSEAAKELSPLLKQEQVRLALIPTDSGHEVLCWEFRCKGVRNEQILAYINTETGDEEDLLIIIASETSSLTM